MMTKLRNREAAAPRAIGFLEAMLEFGHLPECHAARARNIVAQYEQADGVADEWDEGADCPFPPPAAPWRRAAS